MNTSLVPLGSMVIAPSNGIHIAGFEHLDQREDMALPYLRVVQPTSTQAELMDGGDAKRGAYFAVSSLLPVFQTGRILGIPGRKMAL